MSLAWGSLVLLILLLPGVLFFVGIYLPEKFTRQTDARSPLGQLAGVLLIAFLIHGVAYGVLARDCHRWLPCIRIDLLLDVLTADGRQASSGRAINTMLVQFRWWILLYVLGTSGAGVLLGFCYGAMASNGKMRGLSRHPWVHDLSVDGLTYAYVMTHIRHEERYLSYKGFLKAFGLQQDGRFSYVVLSDVTRMYLRLTVEASETSGRDGQRMIGNSSPGHVVLPHDPDRPRSRRHSLFVIEGEDVANVVFDVLETPVSAASATRLREVVLEQAAQIGLVLSSEEIEAIVSESG
jgi:hypothetical protein